MARSEIRFSYAGIGAMLRSDMLKDHMITRAERMMAAAQARAPVYQGPGQDPHRGRYRDSFRIESTNFGGWRHNRASASVVADDPTAVFIEYGTREHTATLHERDGRIREVTIPAIDAHHVLGAALMAAAGDE